MAEIQSKIIKNLAEAESKEIGHQLDEYKTSMQALVALATKKEEPKKETTSANKG